MAEVIKMPRLSDTMTEGVLVKWHKKVGDNLKVGDILADVDTDKATMELENFDEGILLYIGVKEGETVPVDHVIAVIGEEGEDYKALVKEASKAVTKSNEKFELEISNDVGETLRKDFTSIADLNEYLRTIGLEEVYT